MKTTGGVQNDSPSIEKPSLDPNPARCEDKTAKKGRGAKAILRTLKERGDEVDDVSDVGRDVKHGGHLIQIKKTYTKRDTFAATSERAVSAASTRDHTH